MLLFLPLIVIVFAFYLKKSGIKSVLQSIAIFILSSFLFILPVTIRNYRVTGDFVLITANAGINLYIGNNTHTDCVSTDFDELKDLLGDEGPWTCFDFPKLIKGLERKTGQAMDGTSLDSYFRNKAIDFILKHPALFISRIFKKLVLFFSPYEISSNSVLTCEKSNFFTLRYLPSHFAAIFALFLLGIFLFVISYKSLSLVRGH